MLLQGYLTLNGCLHGLQCGNSIRLLNYFQLEFLVVPGDAFSKQGQEEGAAKLCGPLKTDAAGGQKRANNSP